MNRKNNQRAVRKASEFSGMFPELASVEMITIEKPRIFYNLVLLEEKEQMENLTKFEFVIIEGEQMLDQADSLMEAGMKDAKLYPVLTLLLNISGHPWPGPANLKEYFPEWALNGPGPILDYPFRLFDQNTSEEEISYYDPDIQLILELARLQKSPQEQRQWVKEHQEFFGGLEPEVQTFVEKLLGTSLKDLLIEENGCPDSGQAANFSESDQAEKSGQDLYQKGLQEGREQNLDQIIQRLNSLGYSLEEISAITDLSHARLIEKVDQFQNS